MNAEVINYIIRFLVGTDLPLHQSAEEFIGYTADEQEMRRYKIVIRPSHFFRIRIYGTEEAYPKLPLEQWDGVPILYGKPVLSRPIDGGPLVVEADLVASTFFLISRYEEMYKRKVRDEHGRFVGKESLPYKAGFINRPIVDEYGVLLREIMRKEGIDIPEPPTHFSRVNLTHDIDEPFEYRGFRGFLRATIKEHKSPNEATRLAFCAASQDRYFTFPRFLEWNKSLREQIGEDICETVFFFKSLGSHPLDVPSYDLGSTNYTPLLELCRKRDVRFGLHCSYASSLNPDLILREKQHLQKVSRHPIDISRHHYLAAREPEDMAALIAAGIRHDYTMGYADVAGFRLGTSRPVHFIRPCTRRLTDLLLHPLIVMDCTLSRPSYMGFGYQEAREYTLELIRQTAKHHGELNLLWHNVSLSNELHPWLCKLYRELLREVGRIYVHRRHM